MRAEPSRAPRFFADRCRAAGCTLGAAHHRHCAHNGNAAPDALRRNFSGIFLFPPWQSFELPKSILAEPSPFTVANDLLTPTMELRRHQLLRKYGPAIDELYNVLNRRQQHGGGGGKAGPGGGDGAGRAAGEGREAAGAGAGKGGP